MKNPAHETGSEDVQWGREEQNLTPEGPRPQSRNGRGVLARKLCSDISPEGEGCRVSQRLVRKGEAAGETLAQTAKPRMNWGELVWRQQ